MRRYPDIIKAYSLTKDGIKVWQPDETCQFELRLPQGGRYWVPARSLGPSWHRWKATWMVWTGQADALVWPGQES